MRLNVGLVWIVTAQLKKVLDQSHHFNWVQNPVLQNHHEELLYSSNYWEDNKLEAVQQTGSGLVSATWRLAASADEVSALQSTSTLRRHFTAPAFFWHSLMTLLRDRQS